MSEDCLRVVVWMPRGESVGRGEKGGGGWPVWVYLRKCEILFFY